MSKYVYDNSGYQPFIPKKLMKIITESLDIDEKDVKSESTWDSLGADSLDVVEMLVDVENAYSIHVPDEEAEKCYTVGEFVKLFKTLTDEW